jgi:spore germination protein GerM
MYFMVVDDDGGIARVMVKRNLRINDQPLTDALEALFRGPSADELKRGYVSLIPDGSKILSVRMSGNVAVVDVNEAFTFNHLGIEGYGAQLKQVVWTATEFPNVKAVQFLIEGKKRDYLGGEGVYIGQALARNSF